MPVIDTLKIDGLALFTPDRHGDARGWFSETWRQDVWAAAGIGVDFVQDNESFSAAKGTLRGLHFQLDPVAQAKLVRVARGSILDVAVDIRPGSPTFGQHVAVELSSANGQQLFIPAGFAHGFCTLEADTHIAYKVSAYYSPAHDRGIRWNDPDLAIKWPVNEGEAILSEKDRWQKSFKEVFP
jgi:dTDP-4-dehydrorhamnose 3,5-epimerase